MQTKHPSILTLLVAGLAALLPLAAAAQPDLTQLVSVAPLIFRGTVIGAVTPAVPLPPPNDRAFRVRVDQILRGANTIGDYTGQEIVVARPANADRKEALFFVRPVAYGKTLTAEVIGELDASADTRAFAAQIAKVEQQDAETRLRVRLASAEAVIVGRVLAVKPMRESRAPSSEHDPDWAVAQVLVGGQLKGQAKVRDCGQGRCVEVAFAQSDDIRWFRAPKLAVGQGAVFLLRPADPKLLREGEAPPVPYVLIHPDDLRPASEEARLRELIRPVP